MTLKKTTPNDPDFVFNLLEDSDEFILIANALASTNLSFYELLNEINIHPRFSDDTNPDCWPLTFSSRSLMDSYIDVHAFAILMWLYSEDSIDPKMMYYRSAAIEFITKLVSVHINGYR